MLNSYFYRQHLNKIKQIWMLNLRNRVFDSHFPWVLAYICFVGHNNEMHVKVLNQGKRKAHLGQKKHKTAHLATKPGQTLAWQGSRSTQEPTWRRRCGEEPTRVRAHPGCDRTPLPLLRPTLQEAVQLMPPRTVAWVLTKNTSPNHHTQGYIRRPPPHI